MQDIHTQSCKFQNNHENHIQKQKDGRLVDKLNYFKLFIYL
jgi:hypothetical protein